MVLVSGIINNVEIKVTKNNAIMAFVELEDLTGIIELVVFAKRYEQFKHFIRTDHIVLVKGRTNVREDEGCKVLVEQIKEIDDAIVESKLEEKVSLKIVYYI